MRSFFKLSILTAALLLIAAAAFGQVTTGTIQGTVTQDGNAMPGVTVTATSPNLQGERTTVTNETGGYLFGGLPPGAYTLKYELSGLQTITQHRQLGLTQNITVNVDMKVAAVSEAITVTASAPAVAETKEVQTNFDNETIDELPVPRTITGITNLAPGVVGGFNGPAISGGFSFDNLYTVNGAVIQENLRGQPHNLFIEDAIQETTVQVAGISAEFGNFTGGVINAITKSGGNEFSGSFRDTLLNPTWSAESPTVYDSTGKALTSPENTDSLNQTYEATLGGRIIRDRLWFFAAGRKAEIDADRAFGGGANPATYQFFEEEQRLEGKLTGSITPKHSVVASYLEAPIDRVNECQVTGCFDTTSLDASTGREASFWTAQYNGVITNNFLVEARYAKKEFTFIGTGGEDTDRVTGTPIRLAHAGNRVVNEPYFCGTCTPEERDNDAWNLKATYYLGTKSLGTHNLTAGVDHWYETRLSNNFQSPTDFVMFTNTTAAAYAPKQDGSGKTLISFRKDVSTLVHFPILFQSLGSDLNTDAAWVNDRWDINNRWSVNLGVRYQTNDGKDSKGATIADESKFSPRIGVSLDTFGNGRLRFNASYGNYVGRLAETIAGSSSAAGNPAQFNYLYGGEDIIDKTPEEAMRLFWAWVDAQGGLSKITPVFSNVPGTQTIIPKSLVSPNVDELAFGVSTQLGGAFLRADYVHRDWSDFYESQRTLAIGKVTLPNGSVADKQLNTNTDNLTREYDGITLQGAYRLFNRVNIGGNYTWSELRGNASNESVGSVVVTEAAGNYYPEYLNFAQNNPEGVLSTDQTHKLRAWAAVDFPTMVGNFNVSVLQAFDSGSPYSLSGSIDIRSNANFYGTGKAGGVTNPGYQTPPSSVTYFFSDRGEFRFDDVTSTSVALNYDTNPAWLRGVSLFAQAEVLNVFNEDAGSFDTTVVTALQDSSLQRFNPMAGDVPVEGVHWKKGPTFGKPRNLTVPVISVEGLSFGGSFQAPRTYRGSVGIRF